MVRIEENMEGEVMKAVPRTSRIKWVVTFASIGIVIIWAWKTVIGPELSAHLSVKDPVAAFRQFQWVMIAIGADRSIRPISLSGHEGVARHADRPWHEGAGAGVDDRVACRVSVGVGGLCGVYSDHGGGSQPRTKISFGGNKVDRRTYTATWIVALAVDVQSHGTRA